VFFDHGFIFLEVFRRILFLFIGESERIADRSLAARPVQVNPLKASAYNGGKPVGSANINFQAEMLKVL